MITLLRRLIGIPKYIEIPYKWIISKNGRDLAIFHSPVFVEMFWRKVTVEPLIEDIDLYDPKTWEKCDFEIRHYEVNFKPEYTLISCEQDPQYFAVRGVPEKLPEYQWKKLNKKT